MTDNPNGAVSLQYTGNGIATINFYHPAQNSLPSALLGLLADKIDEAGKNGQTRVIILKSGGERTYCAGASFDELMQIKDKETGKKFFSGFANVINAMRKSPQIIIGRVQGKAVGGGVGLAAAADYCLATDAASVKLSEVAIGIGPFVISPAVERKIGISAFAQLTIKATDFQSAQWAKEKGLYHEIYEDINALDTAVNELAEKLASYNPEALTELKKILVAGTENWDELLAERAAVSGELVLSEFTQQALHNFLNKK